MERTGIGFDQNGVLDRHIRGDVIVDGLFGELHVLSHAAINVFLEAVQVVLLTHPILATVTEAALPAGDNLFRDHPIAQLKSLNAFTISHHVADKFVAGDHRRFDVSRLFFIPPKAGGPFKRFNVTGADAAGFNFHQDLLRANFRYRHLL
ncbi:hypothetical protein D3C80_1283090 [compost metagenome]